ncbi:MAG: 4Fe-4S binding protein [Rikenellaceae bacterium]
MLRYIRIAAAVMFGAVFLFGFLALGANPNSQFAAQIAKTQLLPAVMAGSGVILALLIIIALLFGRVYCSVICPMGVMMDVIDSVAKLYRKIFKKKKKKIGYTKSLTTLRYSILGVAIAAIITNIGIVTNLLDPYSNFGAIVTHLVRPITTFFNNVAANILNSMENYSIYAVDNSIISVGAAIFALVVLIIITILVLYRERIYCNAFCPVGTFWGLLSKVSIFKIVIDKDKCIKCKACSVNCKSNCIDESLYYVDNSRCVACFNCLTKCKKDAIHYKLSIGANCRDPFPEYLESDDTQTVDSTPKSSEKAATEPAGKVVEGDKSATSRREFISMIAAGSIMPVMGDLSKKIRLDKARFPLPPGAGSLTRFQSKCTGCQLCVTKCPSHLLKPAMFERGISGFMQPYLDFDVHKFCEFECKVCMEVCPNGALQDMPLEEKKLTQVGIVHFDITNCVVEVNGKHCGACAEHCPTQAVFMSDYKNGLTIPTLNQEICIGCGACESICPVRPNAIYIVGCETQEKAKPFKIEKKEEIEVDDFGF